MSLFSFIGDTVKRTLTNAGPITRTIVKNSDGIIGCYLGNRILTVIDSNVVEVSQHTFASPHSSSTNWYYFLVDRNGTDHLYFPAATIMKAREKINTSMRFSDSLDFWGKCLEESGCVTPDLGEPIIKFQSWAGKKEKVPVVALHDKRLMSAYLDKLARYDQWKVYEIL